MLLYREVDILNTCRSIYIIIKFLVFIAGYSAIVNELMMAAPSSLAHTLHLIHHINDETIVYLDLAKHEQDLIAYRA